MVERIAHRASRIAHRASRIAHRASRIQIALVVCGVPTLGCQSNEVEIRANQDVIWTSPLGADRLYGNAQLGISSYQTPPDALTVRVDASHTRVELLFLPHDAEASVAGVTGLACSPYFPTLCAPTAPTSPSGVSAARMHQGGTVTYPVGAQLLFLNGLAGPLAIRSHYQRQHGECELEVSWNTLMGAVFQRINDKSGEAECNDLFCPNYDQYYDSRVAASYLRRTEIGSGQGGFALYIAGGVDFDSPFIDNLSFKGKAAYDVNLAPSGLPVFQVSWGPHASTGSCSPSPATTCPTADVQNDVKAGPSGAAQQLNDIIAECAVAPTEEPCQEVDFCASGQTAGLLGVAARLGALQRGLSATIAAQAQAAFEDVANWRCAPVSKTCASLVGGEETAESVCQIRLKAIDLVPMPNSFSLMWYPNGTPQVPITTGEALYLGLTYAGQTDKLATLCSPQPLSRGRAFVRRVDNSSH